MGTQSSCNHERSCDSLWSQGHSPAKEFNVQDEQRTLEQMMAKRSGLEQKKGDLEKKIREMGTLPADAFEKYRDHSPKELHKLLQKCQSQLSKYG